MQPPAPDHAAYLDRALAIGAILLERLLDIPTTPDPAATRPRNPATDYQKITGSMRQTVLVLGGNASEPRRAMVRKQIIRAVEDAIHLHAAPRAERLIRELRERLEDPYFDAELLLRPTPDLIDELCRDLHAIPKFETHLHQRRPPAAIAALAAQAGAPAETPLNPVEAPEPDPPAEAPPPPSPIPIPTPTPIPARARRRAAPLSTPSLILPEGPSLDPQTTRPEAHSRDHR